MIQKEQRKVKSCLPNRLMARWLSTKFVYKIDFKLLSEFMLCVEDVNWSSYSV